MITNVTFRHPAQFIGDEEDGGGVLVVRGAEWFAELLRRVPDLQLDENYCQEDWGVVFFAQRNEKEFWIGLSAWRFDSSWLAHFHHGSFAWLQWFSPTGNNELQRLMADFHQVLTNEPLVTEIMWYEQSETAKREPVGFPTPLDG